MREKSPVRWSLLVALIPWVLPTLVVALQRRPEGVDLRGEWTWSPTEVEAEQPVQLPGYLRRDPRAPPGAVFRRTVQLDGRLDEPWLLVLGDLRASVVQLVLNGHPLGELGVWATGQRGELNGLEAFQIPPWALVQGTNRIELRTNSAVSPTVSIADRRLVLGPVAELGEWYLRTSKLESFLRGAPLLVFALLSVLLLVLASLEGPRTQRRHAWRALSLVGASTLYLLLQTGLGFTGWVSMSVRFLALFVGIAWSITAMYEFCFDYFEAWSPKLIWAHRLASVVMVVGGAAGVGSLYLLYSAWSFGVLLWLLVIMVRRLRADRSTRTVLLFSTALAVMSTGLVDIFTDLGLWQLPRLFALSLADAPILIGSVVIGTFIALDDRNRELSLSLTRSNDELARALVEAREATRVKSEFLANVSHELRTPLNSIINIPEGLLEDFAPQEGGALAYVGEAGTTARYLQTLHRSGLHLLGVVNQVLDFSKIEAERLTLTLEALPLAQLVEDVRRTLEPLGASRRVTIALEGSLQGALTADPVKVSQVLLNLGSNAVKYSPDGSAVSLRVEQTAEAVSFHVRDRGAGIAPEHQGLVFEGYRQVEGETTRRFGGTGLGLAISRRLVELHGGTLTLESASGQGSTFTARFPRRPSPSLDGPG